MNSNNQALAIKSVAKFLKLIAVVAFIRYELFNQQQLVLGRAKGLIYNKDGKFIYRPPKSNQGHIIVIDDRPRESSLLNYNSHQASMASPSSYHPYTLINHQQRMFQPDAISLANLVAPITRANGFGTLAATASSPPGDHHQADQPIHMISLNDLQNHHHFPPTAAALVAAAAAAAGAARQAQANALARSFPSPVMNPMLQVMQPVRRFNNIEGLNYLEGARAKSMAPPVGQQSLAELLAEQQATGGMFGLDNQFNDQIANRNLIAHNRLIPFETDSAGAFELPTSMNLAENAFLDEQQIRSQLMLGKGRQGSGDFDHTSLLGVTHIKEEDRHTKVAGGEDFFDEQIPGKLNNDNNSNNNGNNSSPSNSPTGGTNYRKPALESNERARKRSSNFKSKNNDGRSNKMIEAVVPPDTLLLRAGEDYQNKNVRYWKQFRNQFDIVQ